MSSHRVCRSREFTGSSSCAGAMCSCGSPSLAVLGHGGDVAGSQGRACHTTLQDLRELGVGSDHERTCNSYFKIAIDQVIKTG